MCMISGGIYPVPINIIYLRNIYINLNHKKYRRIYNIIRLVCRLILFIKFKILLTNILNNYFILNL